MSWQSLECITPALPFSNLFPRWAAFFDGLLEPLAEDRLTAGEAISVNKSSDVNIICSVIVFPTFFLLIGQVLEGKLIRTEAMVGRWLMTNNK